MDKSWITFAPKAFTVVTNYNYTTKTHLGVENNGYDPATIPYLFDFVRYFQNMEGIRCVIDNVEVKIIYVIISSQKICIVDYIHKESQTRYTYKVEY